LVTAAVLVMLSLFTGFVLLGDNLKHHSSGLVTTPMRFPEYWKDVMDNEELLHIRPIIKHIPWTIFNVWSKVSPAAARGSLMLFDSYWDSVVQISQFIHSDFQSLRMDMTNPDLVRAFNVARVCSHNVGDQVICIPSCLFGCRSSLMNCTRLNGT
jgi:hypothetical protein